MSKQIQLSQGKVAIVDDEDFEYLNQWKWYAVKDGSTFYAVRNSSRLLGKRGIIKMHRVIMSTPEGLHVDHRNRNGLDNRKVNLRNCHSFENQMNKGKTLRNSSGFKGVSWDKGNSKWISFIRYNGKSYNLGRFDSKIDAAKAYNKAAIHYFGEFASLNEIPVK